MVKRKSSAAGKKPAATTTQPILNVDGVTLQYKTKEHLITATYRVGFDVYPADRFALLGPSGCGKSTLLKGIAGYMKPVEGAIRLKGKEISEPGPDRVMVFQEFDQLLPWKTVKQNIIFALHNGGKTDTAAEAEEKIKPEPSAFVKLLPGAWVPVVLAGLALFGLGQVAPPSFMAHFNVFVLYCFIG